MPSRLKRYQDFKHHHFVTFSCHNRLPYLETLEAKKVFQNALEETRRLYDFQIAVTSSCRSMFICW